jgi:putative oxidoreductase
MSRFLASTTPLLARLLVAGVFLYSGATKLLHPAGAAGRIAARGLPLAGAASIAAGVLEVVVGAAIVLGLRTRAAAIGLFVYVVLVSWLFHFRPALGGDAAQALQLVKNGAIAGGLLLLATYGPGPASVDRG